MADENAKSDSILKRMKDRAKEVQTGVSEKIAEVSEAGMEKLKEMIAEVNEIIPFIGELGYTVEGIQIGVGLIPDITIDIGGLTKTMPEETYSRSLEEHKDKKLLISVLKALQTASALQHKIHFLGMRSDNASMTLGLPPEGQSEV